MFEDNAVIGIGFGIIAITVAITEVLARKAVISAHHARHTLHIAAISTAAVVAWLTPNLELLKWISGIATILVFVAVWRRWLVTDSPYRKSWGIAWFALGYTASLFAIPLLSRDALLFAWLVVALCDPLATIMGRRFGAGSIRITGDRKSLRGFGAFVLMTLVVEFALFYSPGLIGIPWTGPSLLGIVVTAVAIAFVLGLTELWPSGGADNLWVPAMALSLWLAFEGTGLAVPAHTAVGVTGFAVLVAKRLEWLDSGGAMSAWLLGIVVLLFGGWLHALLMLMFLISGSVLSRLPPGKIRPAEEGGRTGRQVHSNGMVAGLVLLLSVWLPGYEWNTVFVSVIAAVTADTWSSEIGSRCGRFTFDIIGFKKVRSGISGGISAIGTLGGMAGSAIISGVAIWFFEFIPFWEVFIFGIFGMLVDSVLGSSIQGKYLDERSGELLDEPVVGKRQTTTHGWQFMDNNRVNETMTWIVAISAWLLTQWL